MRRVRSRQRLGAFSAGQLENILGHKRSTQLILRETLSEDSHTERKLPGWSWVRFSTGWWPWFSQGQQKNEFRKDIDPTLAAFMIVSANMFFFQASPAMQHIPEHRFVDDANTFSKGVMDVLTQRHTSKRRQLMLASCRQESQPGRIGITACLLFSACGSENPTEAGRNRKRQGGPDLHPPGGNHGPADLAGNGRPGSQPVSADTGRGSGRPHNPGRSRYR